MKEQVRVLRVIEYTGDRDTVGGIINISIHGEKKVKGAVIRVATVGNYPEILSQPKQEAEET